MRFIDNRKFTLQFTNAEFRLIAKTVCAKFEHAIINEQMALLVNERELQELICLLEMKRFSLEHEENNKLDAIKLERLINDISKEYNDCCNMNRF